MGHDFGAGQIGQSIDHRAVYPGPGCFRTGIVFTNLQLRAVQATDVNADCGFADYFSLRLLATLLGLAAIISLLPFAGASRAVRLVVLLVSLSKCIECMSDVTAGLLQREEQLYSSRSV